MTNHCVVLKSMSVTIIKQQISMPRILLFAYNKKYDIC